MRDKVKIELYMIRVGEIISGSCPGLLCGSGST